ncbi:MAG: hypothetical protein IPH12_17335 [Saprospirales bacterium]|jgi:hypothetical protein|nr:hypothetical protein [Saprospirales bacterium]MBK8920659.1 hypothetical protein [Saprospirales bacterium]
MKALRSFLILLICGSLYIASCGQRAENKAAQETATEMSDAARAPEQPGPGDIQDAMKQAEQTVKDLQGENAKIVPVNFRKLKELLPGQLLGLERTRHTGESAGTMGMRFSTADASYRDGAKRLNVKIMDAGGIGVATTAMAAWSTLEIDKESDKGYEKTYDWGSFKAYETGRNSDGFIALKLFHPAGIIAEIEGYGIPISDLKHVAEQIKLSSVPGMRE